MARISGIWAILGFALILLLFFSDRGGKESHRNGHGHGLLHRRGGPGRRLVVKLNSSRISFDPVVAELEQRREDKGWEKDYIQHKGSEYGVSLNYSDWEEFQKHHGAEEEADDDEFLNDEERFNITERLITLFPLVDVNPTDGFITLAELEKWHIELAESRLFHRTQRELESHDRNNDGLITLKEYLSHLTDEELASNSTEHGDPGWWKEQLSCADEDGDGYLNVTEFHNFLHPEDSKNLKSLLWLCKERIRERDNDKDGKINYSEFVHGIYDLLKHFEDYEPGAVNHTGHALSSQERFDQLDQNKDGFLTAEEILPVLPNLYPGEISYAKYQAQYLLHQADENKDGRLTLEEMLLNPYAFYNTAYDDDDDDDDYDHDEFR